MDHVLLGRLIAFIASYGYAVLFPVALLEGPVAAIVAGAFVASGEFDFLLVFCILLAADLTGDVAYYGLGRWSHRGFIQRIGSRVGLTEERLAPLRATFKAHDWQLLLLGKTQVFGSLILYFAGATRMSLARFFAINVAGTVPKVLLFEIVGYFFGTGLIRSTHYLDMISIGAFLGGLVLLGTYIFARYYLERTLVK